MAYVYIIEEWMPFSDAPDLKCAYLDADKAREECEKLNSEDGAGNGMDQRYYCVLQVELKDGH